MSSNYNSRVYCPEFLLDNGKYKLIKRQQLFDEMIMFETGDL